MVGTHVRQAIEKYMIKEMIASYDGFTNLFITPVWGMDFIREFLQISLPTQLSRKNLGQLSPADNVYCIITTESAKNHIQASSIFKILRKHVTVQFIVFNDIAVRRASHAYELMHEMYSRSLACINSEINCFFLSADIFCSDGLFAHAITAMEAGKKVVFVPTMRVTREPFIENILRNNVTSPNSDETVALILSHEHEMTKAGIVNEASGAIFSLPNHTLYRMRNGYVGRWNVMHPLVIRLPPNPPAIDKTVDWNYGVLNASSPDEIAFFWDSDDGVVLTTAPKEYMQGGSISYQATNEQRTNSLSRWLGNGWALKIHLLQMKGVVCLHSGPIDRDEYATGIAAVDRVLNPFLDVVARYETIPDPDYNKFLNSPAITKNGLRWIRLRSDPIGTIRGALRRIATRGKGGH